MNDLKFDPIRFKLDSSHLITIYILVIPTKPEEPFNLTRLEIEFEFEPIE